MIRTILFDIGEVVVAFPLGPDFSDALDEWAGDIGAEPAVIKRIRERNRAEMFRGKYGMEDLVRDIAAETGVLRKDPIASWLEIGTRRVRVNQPLLDWMGAVRPRYRLVACSNLSVLRQRIDLALGIYGHFDRVFLSTDIGLLKPAPGFFRHVLEELGQKPPEALLIDDLERNLAAAQALGIRTLLFQAEYWDDLGPFLTKVKELGVE